MQHPDDSPALRTALIGLVVLSVLHGLNHTFSIFLSPLNEEIRVYFGARSISAITALKSTYLAVYALSNLGIGIVANRVSARWILSLGLAVNGLAIAAFALVPVDSLGIMHLLWAIAGLGGGVYHPLAMVIATGTFPARKGWALGITGVGAGLGFAFGPLISQVLSRNLGLSWQALALLFGLGGATFAMVSVTAIADARGAAAGASAFSRTGAPADTAVPPGDSRSGAAPEPGGGVRTAIAWPFLLTIVAIISTREITMWSILDVSDFYLERVFAGSAPTGFFLFLLYIPGVIVQPILGHLSDRGDRTRIGAALLALYGLTAFLLAAVPAPLLWLVYLLMGAAQTASVPVIDAIVADRTPDRGRGMAYGILVTFGIGLGAMGPLLFGLVVDAFGGTIAGFHFSFLVQAILLGCGALGMRYAGSRILGCI